MNIAMIQIMYMKQVFSPLKLQLFHADKVARKRTASGFLYSCSNLAEYIAGHLTAAASFAVYQLI